MYARCSWFTHFTFTIYRNRHFFRHHYVEHGLGAFEGHDRYFIFDYDNKLINGDDNNDDICWLFDYLDNKISNDESIHFIFGEQFIKLNKMMNNLCDGKYKHLLDTYEEDLFYYLHKTYSNPADIVNVEDGKYYGGTEYYKSSSDQEEEEEEEGDSSGEEDIEYNLYNKTSDYYDYDNEYDHDQHLWTMEVLYHLTCPALIKYNRFEGDKQHIHLTANNEYIDSNTIKKCHLKYVNISQLDPVKSFIIVDDYLNDANSFKINDFLISDENTYIDVSKPDIGCTERIYKIIDIKIIKIINDNHKILKLSVSSPQSIMDYILYADIDSNEDLDISETRQHETDELYEQQIPPTPTPSPTVVDGPRSKRRRLPAQRGGKAAVESVSKSSSKPANEFDIDSWVPKKGYKKVIATAGMAEKNQRGGKKSITESKKLSNCDGAWEQCQPLEFTSVKIPGSDDDDTKWKFNAKVTGNIKYWLIASLEGEIKYKFHWTKLFTKKDGKAILTLEAIGTFKLETKINLEATIDLSLKIPLGDWSLPFPPIAIGPVPVIITPYVGLDLEFEMSTITFTFSWNCLYQKEITVGYRYSRKSQQQQKVKEKALYDADEMKKSMISDQNEDAYDMRSLVIESMEKNHEPKVEPEYIVQSLHMVTDPAKETVGKPPKEMLGSDTYTKIIELEDCHEPTIKVESTDGTNCHFQVRITFRMKPRVGIKLYGAFKAQALIVFELPITYHVEFNGDTTICSVPGPQKNNQNELCEAKKLKDSEKGNLHAYIEIALSWHIQVKFSFSGPTFLDSLKVWYKLARLYKSVETLVKYINGKINPNTGTLIAKLTDIYDKFKATAIELENKINEYIQLYKAWKQNRQFRLFVKGVEKAIDDAKKLRQTLDTYNELIKDAEKDIRDFVKEVKKQFDEIVVHADKIITTIERIAHNPLKLKEFAWLTYTSEPTAIPFQLFDEIKKKCYSVSDKFAPMVALPCCETVQSVNPFITHHHHHQQQHHHRPKNYLRSAPIIDNNYKPDHDFYNNIFMMEAFAFTTIICCCIGFVACICGGFAGYAIFNITNKKYHQSKKYVNIDQDELEEQDLL